MISPSPLIHYTRFKSPGQSSMKSNRKLRQIARVILENPGISKAQISYLTGLSYNYVRNALANLESYGIFLSEDENAKLYPFNDYNPDNIPDE